MTSFLQPCDSHVFAAFKHDLQEAWRQRKANAPAGQVTLDIWLEIVASAIAKLASKPHGGVHLTAMESLNASSKFHFLRFASSAGLKFHLHLRCL